jgi:hypothetical protein
MKSKLDGDQDFGKTRQFQPCALIARSHGYITLYTIAVNRATPTVISVFPGSILNRAVPGQASNQAFGYIDDTMLAAQIFRPPVITC